MHPAARTLRNTLIVFIIFTTVLIGLVVLGPTPFPRISSVLVCMDGPEQVIKARVIGASFDQFHVWATLPDGRRIQYGGGGLRCMLVEDQKGVSQ